MILFKFKYGIFAWTDNEKIENLLFIKKFQNYLSKYLLNLEDCKNFRDAITRVYKDKTDFLLNIKTNGDLKDKTIFSIATVSDELFFEWKNVTFNQLEIYENKLKTNIKKN